MKLKNLYLALKEQLPLKRFLRNFFVTGNAWGMFSKASHEKQVNEHTVRLKVIYNSKESALKAAQAMSKKTGGYFSAYKCVFCDGWHIGKNRNTK